jgi:antitoxin MazE
MTKDTLALKKQAHDLQEFKWRNGLAIRPPAAVGEALGLKEGDNIEIHPTGRHSLEIGKAPGAKALLARLRKYRGRLPKGFKFDRLEAHGRR